MSEEEKLVKLRNMRFIATGLLVLMTLVYFVFKRFAPDNIFFSSVVAFSEASMVGALADWFAVTALFRHPLGMHWIPHTAIIKKNRDKIAESLSGFVVSNFFTGEVIKGKLENVDFSEVTLKYLRKNREVIADKVQNYLPAIVKVLVDNDHLTEVAVGELKVKLRAVEIHPIAGKALQAFITTEMHVPVVKQLFINLNNWLSRNKEKTIKIIEGMNKSFALPFVGEIIYKAIVKALVKLIEDMENGTASEFNREIFFDMPERVIKEFETSKELQDKVDKLKNDILDSEILDSFINEKIGDIKKFAVSYSTGLKEESIGKLLNILDGIVSDLLVDEFMKENFDNFIKDSIVNVVCSYRQEVGNLISDTIKGWPLDDMVEKMEVQVGGDLQYIRINGTIVGGLVGLAIHWLSFIF